MFAGICTGCTTSLPTFPSLETTTYYECVPFSGPGNPGIGNPTGPGGGGSGNTSGGNNPSPNPSLTSPVGSTKASPCGKLKSLLTTIKPKIESLKATLNQPGENGILFEKDSNGQMQNNIIPTSYGRMLSIKLTSNAYGYVHTHPFTTYPMFSWGDVLTLSQIYENSQPHNKADVTVMMVAKADDGVTDVVYALTIYNPELFTGLINQSWNQEDFIGCSNFDKNKILSEPLDNRFYNQSTTNEQDFLRTFYNKGIDLWKANSTLTSWTKLSLNPLNMQLTETPCN